MKIIIESIFSSGHFYLCEAWDKETNLQNFGKCYSEKKFGHGHDYTLRAEFNISDRANLKDTNATLKQLVNACTRTLDHKHLNHEIEFFKTQNPSTENVALYLKNVLTEKIDKELSQNSLREIKLSSVHITEGVLTKNGVEGSVFVEDLSV